MISLPSGQNVRVWIATGYTDMRCGFPSLALRVQEILKLNPLDGNLFVFRGRSGSLIKVIWSDGQGSACLQRNWTGAGSSGLPPKVARWRYRLRNCLICCPGSTGAIRRKRFVRHGLDSIIALKIQGESDRMAS